LSNLGYRARPRVTRAVPFGQQRHAATKAQRARQVHPEVLGPHEAVRLLAFLMSGIAQRVGAMNG
jgi:hypothetical protein